MLALAAAKGIAWASIDYPSHARRHGTASRLADVKTALSPGCAPMHVSTTWVLARMVLVGESASGQTGARHLAANEPGLAGIVSFYGVYDLEAMAGDPANPRSLAAAPLPP